MFVPSAALHFFNFMGIYANLPSAHPPRDKVSIRPLLGARFIPTKIAMISKNQWHLPVKVLLPGMLGCLPTP